MTDLAKQYGIPDDNKTGNVIVKQFLIDNGINLEQCSNKWTQHNRHSKEKMPGGTGVSMPVPKSAEQLKAALRKDIEDGTLSLGELIEEQKYTKTVIDKDGKTEKVEFTIYE